MYLAASIICMYEIAEILDSLVKLSLKKRNVLLPGINDSVFIEAQPSRQSSKTCYKI